MRYSPKGLTIKVRPHSLWLAYTLKNSAMLNALLPQNLEASPIRLLQSDTVASSKLLFNAYELESLYMNGFRLEVVTIAKHKKTRKTHFVVLDCLTNSLQWDPLDGLQFANANCMSYSNDTSLCVSVENNKENFRVIGKRRFARSIKREFAVEPNRICYFKNSSLEFPMKFNETQVMHDIQMLGNLEIDNTLWSSFRGKLTHAFIHQKSMSFDVFS